MTTAAFFEKIIIPLISAGIGSVIGAILAFRYQRKMEIQRDKRGLMQMLMAYRSVGAIEIDWVKALNMIDIVFHNNKKVKALLRRYMYYTEETRYGTGEHSKVLVELLYEMGQSCGYADLTETDIRDSYSPKSIPHIYASTIEGISRRTGTSEPPPSTNS